MSRPKRNTVGQKTNGKLIENDVIEDGKDIRKRNRKRKLSENLLEETSRTRIKRNSVLLNEADKIRNGIDKGVSDVKLEENKSEKKPKIKEVKQNIPITCAICKQEMLDKVWQSHKESKHNNLAWKLGEPPLDFNDKALVTSLLWVLYKKKKKFKCEVCKISKKSVVGFMSHMNTCSKSEEELELVKVKCEICNKKIMPSSIYSHMKTAHNPQEEKKDDDAINLTRTKRQSALRVTEILKTINNVDDDEQENKEVENKKKTFLINFNFQSTSAFRKRINVELRKNKSIRCRFDGCNYECTTMKELLDHLKKCSFKININKTCCTCFKPFQDDVGVEEHLKECKADEEDDYKNESTDVIETSVLSKKTSIVNGEKKYQLDLLNFIPKNVRTLKACYWPSYKWMEEFCSSNYNVNNLFEELEMNKVDELEMESVIDYLPLNKISIETCRTVERKFIDPLSKNHTYKRYKLFESVVYPDGNSMAFCGGSITKIAWCPTSNNNCDQIISVAINLNPNEELHLNDRNSNNNGLVQFWNFGLLNFLERSNLLPKLEFCIAHNYGHVYDMEWCPSGCHDTNRLGLLAIACSDSHVYIHHIQQPYIYKSKIFKLKSCLKLVLNSLGELNLGETDYQATKLSWSKAHLHEHIAVGYSNGYVAIYHLNLKNLNVNNDNIPVLKPFRTFCAHNSAVTALCLYHMDCGWRWLMTGSADRMQKFWDLKATKEPLVCHRRSNITDGKWPINWIGGITSQDDGTVTNTNSSAYCQIREVGVNPTSFLYSNSTINSVTVCDWGNIFVHGSSCGEIHGSYPHQIFQNIDLERTIRKKKFYLRQTLLIDKDLDVDEAKELEWRKEKTFGCENAKGNFKITDVNQIETDLLREPLNYYQADKQYKMLILDYNLDNDNYVTEQHVTNVGYKSKYLKKSRWNRYEIQSVNNVAFNPNNGSFLYLAAGYKAGFLTCNCIRFLRKNFT